MDLLLEMWFFHHWQFILISLPIRPSHAIMVSFSSFIYSPEADLLKMCIRRPVMLPADQLLSSSVSPRSDWHYWFPLMSVNLLNNLRCLAHSVFILIRSLSWLDVFFDKTIWFSGQVDLIPCILLKAKCYKGFCSAAFCKEHDAFS